MSAHFIVTPAGERVSVILPTAEPISGGRNKSNA